jgi:protein involved in sex pheromone biosynthesis
MKKLITLAFTAAIFLLAACDDEEVQTIDSSMPNGNFMADVSGTFVEQNGTGSMELLK